MVGKGVGEKGGDAGNGGQSGRVRDGESKFPRIVDQKGGGGVHFSLKSRMRREGVGSSFR